MIQLNGDTHKLQAVMSGAVTTTAPSFLACWVQLDGAALDRGDAVPGVLNGTTDVDLVTGVEDKQIKVNGLHVYNRDSVAVTISFKLDVSGTDYLLYKCVLQPGYSVSYSDGWIVTDASGRVVTSSVVADGDYGDITVSSGGTVFTLDTAQPAVHTWALAQTFTAAPVFTDPDGSRDALKIGPRYCFEALADFATSSNFASAAVGPEWSVVASGASATLSSVGGLTSGSGAGRGRIQLGTASTNRVAITTAGSAHALGYGAVQFVVKASMSGLSDGTDTFVQRVGLMDDVTAEPAEGCYFRYTHSVNSGKWECVTRAGGVETATDSGITAVAGTERVWKILVNAAGTSVGFYIDGVLVQTHVANIPTARIGFAAAAIRSAGTAAKNAMSLDLIYARVDFTTPRW